MRSFRLLAATTVIVAGAWACGGDGNGGTGEGDDPVAGFTSGACTANTVCTFTDASSDPQGVATITTRVWNFGDNSGDITGTGLTQDHQFAAEGTYQVKLTVTDNTGKSDDVTNAVTVTAGTPTNNPPTAAFTVPACTVNAACQFTDASTDAEGAITGWSWNFGDGTPLVTGQQNPTHTYTTAGIYPVTLTVTDAGGATNTTPEQQVTVSGAAPTDCTVSGMSVVCPLTVDQQSTALITLVSRACELNNNNVWAQQPRRQLLIFNACSRQAGSTYTVTDVSDATYTFPAGSSLPIEFVQGSGDPGDPAVGAPHARMSGSFAEGFVINIDDGGNPAAPGEPDYDDVVLRVTFTAAP